jgi:glyceraldehyde 3-phosphate dehydrogenase
MPLRVAVNGFGRIGRMVLKAAYKDKRIEDVDTVNAAFKKASKNSLKGILGFSEDPLVSIDYNGNRLSSIVAASCTMVIGGNMVKVISWYDNETGFSHRILDLLNLILSKK